MQFHAVYEFNGGIFLDEQMQVIYYINAISRLVDLIKLIN